MSACTRILEQKIGLQQKDTKGSCLLCLFVQVRIYVIYNSRGATLSPENLAVCFVRITLRHPCVFALRFNAKNQSVQTGKIKEKHTHLGTCRLQLTTSTFMDSGERERVCAHSHGFIKSVQRPFSSYATSLEHRRSANIEPARTTTFTQVSGEKCP